MPGALHLLSGLSHGRYGHGEKAVPGVGAGNLASLFRPREAALVLHGARTVLSEYIRTSWFRLPFSAESGRSFSSPPLLILSLIHI